MLQLQPAEANSNLGNDGVNAAKGLGLVVRQLVHGRKGHVYAFAGMVDGQDVDGLAVVRGRPASSALFEVLAGEERSDRDEGMSLRLESSTR